MINGKNMHVLVACEESQRVCAAFRELGHEAYSCDIEPCSGGRPEWHIQSDVLPLLDGDCTFQTGDGSKYTVTGRWDMIIAFPPCTHLAVSGARYFGEKRKDGRQQQGIDFFMRIANANCDRIAIENPVGIMSGKWRKPDQIIQPWMFGDNASKRTCLWIKGLPRLIPDVAEQPDLEYVYYGNGRKMQKWMYDIRTKSVKDGYRAKLASKTFPGIARAMAEQWGGNMRIREGDSGQMKFA